MAPCRPVKSQTSELKGSNTWTVGLLEAVHPRRSSTVRFLVLALVGLATVTQGPSQAGSNEYVSGLGWRDSRQVALCLQAVGAEETDDLTDWKWDDFVSCMAPAGRR